MKQKKNKKWMKFRHRLITVLARWVLGPYTTIKLGIHPERFKEQGNRQYLILMLLFMALYVFAYSINTVVVCGIFPAGGDAKYDAISVHF